MSADTAKCLKDLEEQLRQLEEAKGYTERKLQDLHKQRKDAEYALMYQSAEAFKKVLTKELIDVLAPTHGGRTCTDTDRKGAYMDHGQARCTRCFLLDELNKNYICDPFRVEVRIVGIEKEREF
jgi:hypothetical protein